ncbi:hypothetical protein SLITO_v1c10770 [Spiroplasma litorale]|uniref:Lipoprotein n=1 Tax=Spiroplasma litorale TaxID=216942 RepID=A0A0K1W3D0_9MOLU|nr:hypothetical protein [Spiroplasma litorale]AKX34688.1 hypothetical protein SLITO_v1c10770 [Spiroplasma litorale]
MKRILKFFSLIPTIASPIVVTSCDLTTNFRQTKVYLEMVEFSEIYNNSSKASVEENIFSDISQFFRNLNIEVPDLDTDYSIGYSEGAFTSDNTIVTGAIITIKSSPTSDRLLGQNKITVLKERW